MSTIVPFPKRPHLPEAAVGLDDLRALICAEPLTLDEVLTGDVSLLRQPGPFCAQPGSELAEWAERIEALGAALRGPGRVRLEDAVAVLQAILNAFYEDGVQPSLHLADATRADLAALLGEGDATA